MRLPGFFHQKGEPFQCRIVEMEDALAPYSAEQILSEFSSSTAQQGGSPNTTGQIIGERISEGGRNSGLLSVAGKLRAKALDQQDIEAILLAVNHARCDPPLDAAEVLDIARRYQGPHSSDVTWTDVEGL